MSNFVDNAKGMISVLRDGLIALVLVLLLLWPRTVNNRLMAAGFTKGSIAGFEWEATVKDNNEKLQVAANTIDILQDQVTKTEAALKTAEDARQKLANDVKAQAPGTPIADVAAQPLPVSTTAIVAQNNQVVEKSQVHASDLRAQIQLNNNLLARVGAIPH